MSAIKIKENEFEEKIKNSKNKVLIDCYAEWCGPCKMLSPVIDELASNIENCDFYKINIEEADKIANKYQIMSIPTMLLFEDGILKEKVVGFRSKEELIKLINS